MGNARDLFKKIRYTKGFRQYEHFNTKSSDPLTWDISPLICVFSFFHQCHSFHHESHLLGQIYSNVFYQFDVIIYRLFSLFFSDQYQCIEMKPVLYVNFVP